MRNGAGARSRCSRTSRGTRPSTGGRRTTAIGTRSASTSSCIRRPRRRWAPSHSRAVLKRTHKRWLVDAFVPAASFAKEKKAPRILAQPDFLPNMVTGLNDKSRLSASWLLLPAAVPALIVLVPIGVLLLNVRRNRRALLAYRRSLT